MSGDNRKGREDREGREQSSRGRVSQQQAGGQPPRGAPTPQEGGGGGGGSEDDTVKNVLIWGIAVFAIAGITFGVLPILFGFVGNPNDSLERVSANATEAEQSAAEEALANEIVRDDLSDDNRSAAAAYERKKIQNRVIWTVIDNPFVGLIFAIVFAFVIGLKSTAETKTLAVGVAVATIVGLLLFVVLSTAIAGFQYNSMSEDDWKEQYDTDPSDWGYSTYPSDDIDQETQDEWEEEYEDEFDEPTSRDVSDVATVPSISTIRPLQINYGTVIVNTLLYGIVAALGAGGIAAVSRRESR